MDAHKLVNRQTRSQSSQSIGIALLSHHLRSSLSEFVKLAWPLYEPNKKLVWSWHLDVLCSVLEKVSHGSIKRLVINIPPGTGKSGIVSVLWPVWWWTWEPSLRSFFAAYSDDNTIRDNLFAKNIVTSAWYKTLFWGPQPNYPNGIELSADQSGKIRFNNTASGYRLATSVGGTGTGEHPNLIVIDDPLKAKDIYSEAKIKDTQLWYDGTISMRRTLDPAEVIIMQRLVEGDLSGYAMSKGDWQQEGKNSHLLLPMEYEPETPEFEADGKKNELGKWSCPCHKYGPDFRDRRTLPGQLLCPELISADIVEDEKLRLGPLMASGQLQQRPVPLSGGLFKREYFDIVDAIPFNVIDRCRGWDTADTADGGDWNIGVKMSKTANGIFYVEHVDRGQIGTGDVDKRIKHYAQLDGKQCKIAEGSGSGKAVTNKRAVDLAGYDYQVSPETENKILRAGAFRAQCEVGNVKVVRGDWNDAWLSVVCAFPVGKYDDDVDAAANAFNRLSVAKSYAGTGRLFG